MPENKELRAIARSQLKGKWPLSIGVTLIFCTLLYASCLFFGIGFFIVGGPLTIGFYAYLMRIVRGEKTDIENVFDGFKNNMFKPSLILFLLYNAFVLLWTLLLIVPGIIKSISYSMAFYILRDNPDMPPREALRESERMMKGYKMKYFLLCLSFFGWLLLCSLTFGIGFLWLGPYMYLAITNFYEKLKSNPGEV